MQSITILPSLLKTTLDRLLFAGSKAKVIERVDIPSDYCCFLRKLTKHANSKTSDDVDSNSIIIQTRCVRLLLQLLIVVVIFLLYSYQEEAMGELKAFHAKIFPPSLPPSPTWTATRAALKSLPPMPATATVTKTASTSSCHFPVLDPWHPDILPYVSEKPSLVTTYQ